MAELHTAKTPSILRYALSLPNGPMTADDIRQLRAMAGDRPFDIAVVGSPRSEDVEADRVHVRSLVEAGATWWVEWMAPTDRESMRNSVDRGPLRQH